MGIFEPPSVPLVFQKCYLRPYFLWHYHKLYFYWKCDWNPSSRSEYMKSFLGFFDISFFDILKLMTSTYNTWCQQMLSFNLLQILCLTIVRSCTEFGLVLPEENTSFKKPNLIRVKEIGSLNISEINIFNILK